MIRPDRSLTELATYCAARGFPLSDAQIGSFLEFRDALYEANRVMNLTRVSFEDCEVRHFVDSLLAIDLVPLGANVLDIGSGPGFPAWPLACARPDTQVVALDSSGKMIRFLQRQPLSNLSCLQARAEELTIGESFDVVTGRALAPLPIQLELSSGPCRIGGFVLPMRTPAEQEAVKAFVGEGLGLELERLETRVLPGTDVVRLLPVFRKVSATQSGYPRTWVEIRRRPLR